MNKKIVAGIVLAAALFGAVWGSGLASAGEGANETSPANSVVDDVRPANGPGAGGLPFG